MPFHFQRIVLSNLSNRHPLDGFAILINHSNFLEQRAQGFLPGNERLAWCFNGPFIELPGMRNVLEYRPAPAAKRDVWITARLYEPVLAK